MEDSFLDLKVTKSEVIALPDKREMQASSGVPNFLAAHIAQQKALKDKAPFQSDEATIKPADPFDTNQSRNLESEFSLPNELS